MSIYFELNCSRLSLERPGNPSVQALSSAQAQLLPSPVRTTRNWRRLRELAVSSSSLSTERRWPVPWRVFSTTDGRAEDEPGGCLAGGGQDVKRDPKV